MTSMAVFWPHGLIKTPIEHALYLKAHIANIYNGIADPKEYETTALMTTILYSNVFTTRENFAVNSEQPPNPKSKFRCDIVVRYLESGTEELRALCFAECKRASTNQPFSLKALEEQAFEYSKAYLKYQKMPFVYAATMAGAHVRLWGCWPEMTEMEPFWGEWTAGDWSQYKDVGRDTDTKLIEDGFTRMKQFPPTAHAGQTSETYGTSGKSSSTTSWLPAGYSIPSQAIMPSVIPAGHSAPNYMTARSGFPAASGIPSGITAPLPYQTTGAGPAGYSVSYSTAGPAPSIHPDPDSKQSLDTQTSGAKREGRDEEDKQGDQGEGDEEIGRDQQMSDGAEAQHGAPSNTESKYTVVCVTRKTHMLGTDDFVFKDSKGRQRATKRADWKRAVHNGVPAWKYSRYICLENQFK